MDARLGRLALAVLAGGALWVLAAASSPAPANAAITIFTAASPGEPVATLTRFTCSFRRIADNSGQTALRIRSAPSAGYRLSATLPFRRYGEEGDIPYGPLPGGNTPFVALSGPQGLAANVDGGPPGLPNAGRYKVNRRSFGIGVIAIGGGGGKYAFGGGGTCPRRR